MTSIKLTPKQEAFCLAYMETGNASEAYRRTYGVDGMKAETIHRKAKELMDNGKITARIEEIQATTAERHKLTVDDLLSELDQARQLAMKKGSAMSAVSATMGKARLLGYDKPKIEIQANIQGMDHVYAELDSIYTKEQQRLAEQEKAMFERKQKFDEENQE